MMDKKKIYSSISQIVFLGALGLSDIPLGWWLPKHTISDHDLLRAAPLLPKTLLGV